jgi:hypothetical protein
MNIHTFLRSIGWLALLTPSLLLAAQSSWKVGTYKLQTDRHNSGLLTLSQLNGKSGSFSLDVVLCMNYCGTDSAINHVGEVENGKMAIRGRFATYMSSGLEGEKPDLGICRIDFKQNSVNSIRLKQSGNCWWFGEGVNVSGIYIFEATSP